jgi:hypothetical protein
MRVLLLCTYFLVRLFMERQDTQMNLRSIVCACLSLCPKYFYPIFMNHTNQNHPQCYKGRGQKSEDYRASPCSTVRRSLNHRDLSAALANVTLYFDAVWSVLKLTKMLPGAL